MTLILILLFAGVIGLIGWAWWLDSREAKFDSQGRERVGIVDELHRHGRRR